MNEAFQFSAMFIRRDRDELQRYLEWRRQTRFIRWHGGPILAITLFTACVWYVRHVVERAPRLDPVEQQVSEQLWQNPTGEARRNDVKL